MLTVDLIPHKYVTVYTGYRRNLYNISSILRNTVFPLMYVLEIYLYHRHMTRKFNIGNYLDGVTTLYILCIDY